MSDLAVRSIVAAGSGGEATGDDESGGATADADSSPHGRSDEGLHTPIPHWTDVPDYFVFEAFDWASRDSARTLHRESAQQEALLADTDNFYVVPDQFGVVDGHVLMLPKAPVTSIAALDEANDAELTWFMEHITDLIADAYGAHVVVAEHGECGCATAGQAHIHLLPIPAWVTPEEFRSVVDRVLARRVIGIERVVYKDAEFTAPEDIAWLVDENEATVIGRQLRIDDFPRAAAYPTAARALEGHLRPYVYLAGPGVRFVSTRSLRSQFVREVVAVATGQAEGVWDRRVHPARDNMFATFATLAPGLVGAQTGAFGYRPRGGTFVPRETEVS